MKYPILVVDDDPEVLEAIQCFLSAEGHEVKAVSTGEECLNMLRETEASLILLDFLLPAENGIEVLRKIKSLKPWIPVVIVTGLNDDAIGRKALEEQACDYVTKPIDLQYLKRVIHLLAA